MFWSELCCLRQHHLRTCHYGCFGPKNDVSDSIITDVGCPDDVVSDVIIPDVAIPDVDVVGQDYVFPDIVIPHFPHVNFGSDLSVLFYNKHH